MGWSQVRGLFLEGGMAARLRNEDYRPRGAVNVRGRIEVRGRGTHTSDVGEV